MIRRTISMEEDLWQQAIEKSKKSGLSLSAIIRALLKLWINGKVEIVILG